MDYRTGLPIEEVLPGLLRALEQGPSAVLEAPPGAGKTTVVPLALLDAAWLGERRIVMLEPRRLAARAAAYRMADILHEQVGETVGYRTRLDTKVGPRTRIEVVTEGVLTRFLQTDPSLEGVGIVIFDEFHERSIHADLGLALTLDAISALREDLRVLIMSATIDGAEVAELLGRARVIRCPGRMFPVEVRYKEPAGRLLRASGRRPEYKQAGLVSVDFISSVVRAVTRALSEERGGVLVFLPGAGEIKRVLRGLNEQGLSSDVDVVPLYGMLSREDQDLAIRPSPPGRRKVVLATSIAETSLTIDGVRVVIDSGLRRKSRFSSSTGMSTLETMRVTRDSAEQRCGRAGRQEPGACVRLWTEAEDRALLEKKTPEVLEADLTALALELAVWGVKDPTTLKWLDPPPTGAMAHATETLKYLGALTPDETATAHGKEMATLPLHPRLAHMVLMGRRLGLGPLACLLSSLLTERDIFRPSSADPDIRHRLDVLIGAQGRGPALEVDKGLLSRIKMAAKALEKRLNISGRVALEDVDRTGLLLAFAYTDRIGKRRVEGVGRYLLSNGRGAILPGAGPLTKEDYMVAAHLDGGERESRIYLAAPVAGAELEEHFKGEITESSVVAWDQTEGGVTARRRRTLWKIVLSEKPIQEPDPAEVLKALIVGIRQNGAEVLPWDDATRNLISRMRLLKRVGAGFPEATDHWLMDNLEAWLAPHIYGMTRLEHLKKLDLGSALLGMLTWEERRELDRLAPTHITVPSGSHVALDYTLGDKPVLAVRLQEVFGMRETPKVADGKVGVLMHLLSPARRPVQVTEDLAGFWATGYNEVRKELKGRYPKHHWPENPLRAEPVRGVKRKKG